jgi:endonuclease III
MNTIQAIKQIERDFENGAGPFSDTTFPETRLLNEVAVQAGDSDASISFSMEDRLALISAFATFDYNRDANQLVDNLLELHEYNPKWFNAWNVPDSEQTVEHVFEEIGFRYPSRDAHAWVTNCEILRQKYHGRWSELVMSSGCDAPTLVERLNEDDFLCLKGVKIAPMYARIINDEVCDLSGVWDLDIPVDTHIRRLSKDLFSHPMQPVPDEEITDDDIRSEWRRVADDMDISLAVVDGALWHIGNKWDEWGEDYWETL